MPKSPEPGGAMPSAGGLGAQPGWLMEAVRGRRSRRGGASGALWLGASLFVHLVALLLLATIQFGEVEVKKPEIQINTDLIDSFQNEPPTQRQVIDLSENVSPAERAAALRRTLEGAGENVPVMEVDPVKAGALDMDLLPRKIAATGEGWGRGQDLTGAVDSGGKDYKAVLDTLARHIQTVVKRERLLVTILFDESQSLLDDRVLVAAQLERTFADLKFGITDREEQNLRWAVVSFSDQARPWLQPTDKMDLVRAAIGRMRVDTTSGKENVVGALHYVASQLGGAADRMFILLVSDEEGDDIGLYKDKDDKLIGGANAMRNVVMELRRRKAYVFVLGREAMMEHGTLWMYIKRLEASGYLARGLPTCRPELPGELDYIWLNRGYVPAGFGPYSLSLLAKQTGGQFFVLSEQKSPYDEQMLAGYEPEWVFPDEYDTLIKTSPVRSAVAEIIAQMPKDVPHGWQWCKSDWVLQKQYWQGTVIKQIDEKLKWCDAGIERLNKLEGDLRRERNAQKRWVANWELTRAELYKMKAMLMQYRAVLGQLMRLPRFPIAPPNSKDMGLYVVIAPNPKGRYFGGRAEENALRYAKMALEAVVRHHNGTPWAERARREIAALYPYNVDFNVRPLHTAPSKQPPPL